MSRDPKRWLFLFVFGLASGCQSEPGVETGDSETGDSETGEQCEPPDDPGPPPSAGSSEALGCEGFTWARVDPSVRGGYGRVLLHPYGGTLVAALADGLGQGAVIRRGSDAEVRETIVRPGLYGSELDVAGVDACGNYVVSGFEIIDQKCEVGQEGPSCEDTLSGWLRSYDRDDVLLWERSGMFDVIGVRGDGVFFTRSEGECIEFGADGEVRATRPIPEDYKLAALSADGGFFASGQWNKSGLVARFDEELALSWTVDVGGDHNAFDQFLAPVSDGGVVVAGAVYDAEWKTSFKLLRLDAKGELMWSDTVDDWEIGFDGDPGEFDATFTLNALAAGPGGEVAVAGISYRSSAPWASSWIRLYSSEGVLLATQIGCQSFEFNSLALGSDELVVAGEERKVSDQDGVIAGYSW